MLEQRKLEAINREIREIRQKLKRFQSRHQVSPKDVRRRSPVQRIEKVESILSRSKSKQSSYAGLHHSQLDLVIGECLFSPLNYSPAVNYPKSSQNIIHKVHALKGMPHSEQDLPYDVEVAKKEFVSEVLRRKPRNSFPQSSLSASSFNASPTDLDRRSSLSKHISDDPKSPSLPTIKNKGAEQKRAPTGPTTKPRSSSTSKRIANGTANVAKSSPYLESMKRKPPSKAGKKSSSQDSDDFDFLFDAGEKRSLARTKTAGEGRTGKGEGGLRQGDMQSADIRTSPSQDSREKGLVTRRASSGSLEPLQMTSPRRESLSAEAKGSIQPSSTVEENPQLGKGLDHDSNLVSSEDDGKEEGYDDEFEDEIPVSVEVGSNLARAVPNGEHTSVAVAPVQDRSSKDEVVGSGAIDVQDNSHSFEDEVANQKEGQDEPSEVEEGSAMPHEKRKSSVSRRISSGSSERFPLPSSQRPSLTTEAKDREQRAEADSSPGEIQDDGYDEEFEDETPFIVQQQNFPVKGAPVVEQSSEIINPINAAKSKNIGTEANEIDVVDKSCSSEEVAILESRLNAPPAVDGGSASLDTQRRNSASERVSSGSLDLLQMNYPRKGSSSAAYEVENDIEPNSRKIDNSDEAQGDRYDEDFEVDNFNTVEKESAPTKDLSMGMVDNDRISHSFNTANGADAAIKSDDKESEIKVERPNKTNDDETAIDDVNANEYGEDAFDEETVNVRKSSADSIDRKYFTESVHPSQIELQKSNSLKGDVDASSSLTGAKRTPIESHGSDSQSNDAGDVLGDPYTVKKPPRIIKRFSSDELENESDILTPITTARNQRRSFDPSTVASTTSSIKTTNLEYYMNSRVDYQGSAASDDNNSIGSAGDDEQNFTRTLETFIERQKSENIERMNSLPGGLFFIAIHLT